MDDNNSKVIQEWMGGKTVGHPCQDCFECDEILTAHALNVGSLPQTHPLP